MVETEKSMKSRWLVNIILLALVLGISAFLYLRPAKKEEVATVYEVSRLKLASISQINIEFPAKAPVKFEKREGAWWMTAPYQARADLPSVQRILAILGAKSNDKFPTNDLAKFGLDNPRLKVKLDQEEFLFGTFNTVAQTQYVLYKDGVYLLDSTYEEAMTTQDIEMVDKRMLTPTDKIAGFDFSKLEQWEQAALEVNLEKGQWHVSTEGAKPNQAEMAEWFSYWEQPVATQVEMYKPDRHTVNPRFTIKLQDGRKIQVDKLQESPELLLARPDEGIIYHYPADFGFTLLNPPVGLPK